MARVTLRKGIVAFSAAALVVLGVGGLALWLDDDGGDGVAEEAPPLVATTVTTAPPATTAPTTTAPTTTTLLEVAVTEPAPANGGDHMADEEGYRPEGVPLPPMGIASVDFDWQVVDLPIPPDGAWLNQLLAVGDGYWAVGARADDEMQREVTFVLTSADGIEWSPYELPEAVASAGIVNFWGTGEGVVGVAERWDEIAGPHFALFTSPDDGVTWAERDLTEFVGDGQHMWISGVAGGDGTIVLTGAREQIPGPDWQPPVVVIERDGLIVEVDEAGGSYVITDADSGEVVSHGSIDQLWAHESEGIAVYDPAVREIVFRAPWPDFDEAAVVAFDAAVFGEPLVIEVTSEGATLAIDQYTGALTVTDAAGTVRYTGVEDELWRGAPPTFTDPRSGEVLLSVPWEEWEAAYEAAYGEGESGGATPVLLTSGDAGATWAAAALPAIDGDGVFHFNDVTWEPGGFLAVGVLEEPTGRHEASVGKPVVLRSADGTTWTVVTTDLGATGYVHGVTPVDEGYLAMLGGPEGTRVVASADGRAWQKVLSNDDLRLPLGSAWFDRFAESALGRFVSGSWNAWEEPVGDPVLFTRDGRTLAVAGPLYTVTDDATGAVLFEYDEREYQHDEPTVSETGFRWGPGGLAMFDDAGNVAYAISHRSFEEGMADTWREPEVVYEHESFVVRQDGAGWVRVTLPDELGPESWCAGLLAGDDRLIVAMHSDTYHGGHAVETALRILVGTPHW